MKVKILIFFLVLFQCAGCNNRSNKSEQSLSSFDIKKDTVEKSKVDFINYPIDKTEGIVSTKDDGVYRNFDFNYLNGETYFLLVPKIGATKWYNYKQEKYKENIDKKIELELNQSSLKELSKQFNIWVFHIDKQYLKSKPNLDIPYLLQIPRRIDLFKYEKRSWLLVNKFQINNANDVEKENTWRAETINEIIEDSNNFSLSPNSINSVESWDGNYLIKLKQESYESDKLIEVTYYLNINGSSAVLSINAGEEVPFCEGEYELIRKENYIHLIHIGETGACSDDPELNSFDIQKHGKNYFIRSRNFLDFDWKKLIRK